MEAIATILTQRISRANLDTTKSYVKVRTMKGQRVEEEVGKFVKSYQMGSGDGTTLHWEFIKDGKTIRVDDEMWGTIDGNELVGFMEKA